MATAFWRWNRLVRKHTNQHNTEVSQSFDSFNVNLFICKCISVSSLHICFTWFYKDKSRKRNENVNIPKNYKNSVHRGVSASVHAGIPPPPRSRPPGADTPPPREQTPPRSRHAPPRSACWEIRSTSGRYASYWNAILLQIFLTKTRSLTGTAQKNTCPPKLLPLLTPPLQLWEASTGRM